MRPGMSHLTWNNVTKEDFEQLQAELDRYREALDEAIQFFRNADLGATAIYLEGKRDGAVGATARISQRRPKRSLYVFGFGCRLR